MTERPYLPCREVIDFLYLYLTGELPEEEAAEFERHLGVCPSCVLYIESYRQTIVLGRAALRESDEDAQEAPEALVAAIRAARRQDV